MASDDHAALAERSTATDNEKDEITSGNHVERIETLDKDTDLAKVEADAKLDEFGARSKTNPAEIALVKKLDRTILVSFERPQDKTPSLTGTKTAPTMDHVLVGHLLQPKDFCTAGNLTDYNYCSFNFLDRNALVNAKLNSLDEDLGLKGTEYNTLISILFVGYIAGQIPSNMILNRVRPSWYMGGMSNH
jgi:hypothetical protein